MRRVRKPINQINVVPYIDVMLVLLVIFMVTAPLITPGVIDLPSVGKAGQPKSVPLEVIVKEDQQIIVRERDATGHLVSEQPVNRAALLQIERAQIRRKFCRQIRTAQREVDDGFEEAELVAGVVPHTFYLARIDRPRLQQRAQAVRQLDLASAIALGPGEGREDVGRQHVAADDREI